MPKLKAIHVLQYCLLLTLVIGFSAVPLRAQAAPEYVGKIDVSYKKLPDERRELTAVVTANDLPIENMLVNFYVGAVGRDGGHGNVATDQDGHAVQIIDTNVVVPVDEEGYMTFIVRTNHDALGQLESQVRIKDASLKLSVNEEDATITALLQELTAEGPVPGEMSQVLFRVVRSFGDIGFGGDFTFTDDDGEVKVEFPSGVPNDAEGKVSVMVVVERHDDYGTLVQLLDVPFGQAWAANTTDTDRALWAGRDNAPWWLLITANLLLVGIWGMIVYVLLLVRRISAAGPKKS